MEILAPVGDAEMLRAAVFSGADCVYLGIAGFGARRGADFEGEALEEAVAFCHGRGCGAYAALNTLVLPGREAAFAESVLAAANAGCDGLILQDLGGAMLAKKLAPRLPLHASTQMSVHSPEGVRMLARLGFARVILAREMSEGEIEQTALAARQAGVELEVFVQGALCVSVSGQCMMSAFLGGRSGNQGACAGPCRLPFRAESGSAEGKNAPARDDYHLSLKDLSILDALPRLAAMGVASAKIEGRLRGSEYCAVAVDSARRALRGEEYDKQLLRDLFSRAGFTDGWFAGRIGKEMFGARGEADGAATRAALPRARALYRREMPRVPVSMALEHWADGWTLRIIDGTHEVSEPVGPPVAGAVDEAALRSALTKTGGTPFYIEKPGYLTIGNGAPLPAPGAAKAARRAGLAALLALRGAPRPRPTPRLAAEALLPKARRSLPRENHPLLRARFASAEQMPPEAGEVCGELLLPLFGWKQVPEKLREKTRLWLPRVLFGAREEAARRAVGQTSKMGFAGYEAENIAHLGLCEGLPVSGGKTPPWTGGAGLNTANALTAEEYSRLGCESLTLSPELNLAQMRQLVAALPEEVHTDALCYGRVPLMITRACPQQNASDCGHCGGAGALVDRRGTAFPVVCEGGLSEGYRTVYNSVPLWMGDRLAELPTRTATLYFTTENREEAAGVLRAFALREEPPGPFTRGLYTRGVTK